MLIFQIINTFGKFNLRTNVVSTWCRHASNTTLTKTDEEEFRVLDLNRTQKAGNIRRRRVKLAPKLPPRELKISTDQAWSDIWPGPRTFHPATVPLPIRQGLNKLGASPTKWANTELLKIPNFLHLTPPAIKKHCQAIKKFCTQWPQGLEAEEQMMKHFPMEVISFDYCYSSPSIRNPLARITTIKFPLNRLEFDRHSKDKFLRLVGERYDASTGIVTIVTDKCPLKGQNYDYALYLLTALYHESWITEPWESEKVTDDNEVYDWDNGVSKENVLSLFKLRNEEVNLTSPIIEEYKKGVIDLFEDESDTNINKYKEAAKALLFSSK